MEKYTIVFVDMNQPAESLYSHHNVREEESGLETWLMCPIHTLFYSTHNTLHFAMNC